MSESNEGVLRPTEFEVSLAYRKLVKGLEKVLITSTNWADGIDVSLLNRSRTWFVKELERKLKKAKNISGYYVVDYEEETDEVFVQLVDSEGHKAWSLRQEAKYVLKQQKEKEAKELFLKESSRKFGLVMDDVDRLSDDLADLAGGVDLKGIDRWLYRVKNKPVLNTIKEIAQDMKLSVGMVRYLGEWTGNENFDFSQQKSLANSHKVEMDPNKLFNTYEDSLLACVKQYQILLAAYWRHLTSPNTEKLGEAYMGHIVHVYFKLEYNYIKLRSLTLKDGDFIL